MPRYFTHLYDPELLADQHGEEFADLVQARSAARRAAGQMISDHILRDKVVDLRNRLEITNEAGQVVSRLSYAELFRGFGSAPEAGIA